VKYDPEMTLIHPQGTLQQLNYVTDSTHLTVESALSKVMAFFKKMSQNLNTASAS
jgi:hypothetical protein